VKKTKKNRGKGRITGAKMEESEYTKFEDEDEKDPDEDSW